MTRQKYEDQILIMQVTLGRYRQKIKQNEKSLSTPRKLDMFRKFRSVKSPNVNKFKLNYD